MAVRRNVATTGEQLDLRSYFRNDSTGTLFDPVAFTQVEILDTDASTVLETIVAGNIVQLGVGYYQIITAAAWNTTARLIYDRWYFQRVAGGTVYTTLLNTYITSAAAPAAKYSTVTQLRNNVPRITAGVLDDALITSRISEADKKVETDLGNIVDFSAMPLITDIPATPDYINLASQYKTAELSLVAVFSSKRMAVEVTDWEYWQTKYNDLIADILAGNVALGAFASGTSVFNSDNFPRDGIEPALGQAKYGEWANEDDIEDIREEFGNQDE